MKNLLTIFTLIIITLNSFAQNKISYEKGELFSENQLGIDTFYFVHQTFADAFYMTDLYKQLSDDEMYSILYNAYYSVTKEQKVLVIIEQPSGPDARLGFNFFDNTDKLGDILVLATNFNSKRRVFQKEGDSEESIYRWYKIDQGKLVYRKDVYSEKAEKENRERNSYSLIGMYLFDDNFENDDKVKPLIDELLASEKGDLEKLYGYLYLGEYWLLNNDLIKAEEAVDKLTELLNSSDSIPKGYSLIAKMATTELEIMKRFSNGH